ncbi:spore gernimation protein GerPD [Ammoniphilus sp. CFH 90114]|uniref:spore gernimation protein GerPD n=1 Tax=Ammoniphilus sp. CFH 90114 TaxID=2493665 RepID=UPI00100E60B3|nr:spore gernimation protein GerPD [Ammoniphilus sp. CFH 90114]RXT06288.1 spore gernimation protein GerPD [Ammoniphilus sp. CFH 90114]
MRFSVVNGRTSVGGVAVTDVAASSILIIGDVRTVSLASTFETPAENLIVGVTVPLVTPIVTGAIAARD